MYDRTVCTYIAIDENDEMFVCSEVCNIQIFHIAKRVAICFVRQDFKGKESQANDTYQGYIAKQKAAVMLQSNKK